MKPTVGRIVHFYTSNPEHQHNGVGLGPYPAIVQQMFSTSPQYDTMANLKVMHWGGLRDEGSVCEREQAIANGHMNAEGTTGRWWVWPPRD